MALLARQRHRKNPKHGRYLRDAGQAGSQRKQRQTRAIDGVEKTGYRHCKMYKFLVSLFCSFEGTVTKNFQKQHRQSRSHNAILKVAAVLSRRKHRRGFTSRLNLSVMVVQAHAGATHGSVPHHKGCPESPVQIKSRPK